MGLFLRFLGGVIIGFCIDTSKPSCIALGLVGVFVLNIAPAFDEGE